jgi:hypothetical protein
VGLVSLGLGCNGASPKGAGAPVVIRPAPVLLPPADDGGSSPAPDAAAVTLQAVDSGADAARDQPYASVRSVDWCNLGYPGRLGHLVDCRGSRDVRHSATEGIHSFEEFRFVSATYGDLNGDGREDALLLVEGETRPVVMSVPPTPPDVEWTLVLVDLRGAELYVYPTVGAGDAPVVAVGIAKGVATLVRRRGVTTCREEWRLVGEELTAGTCK